MLISHWDLLLLFAVWLYTNHRSVVKYWSLCWNEIISWGPSPGEPGRLRLSRGGICPGWLCSPRMHTLSTPHARQSKARLRGPLWVNSLAGPWRTETCLLFAATHSRFSSPLTELRSRTPHRVIGKDRAQFIPVLSLLFITRAKNRFFFSLQ